MMVPHSSSELDYTRVIGLNKTAAYLLQETGQKDFTKEDWIELLIAKYSVEREVALTDVQKLIDKLKKEELIDV